MIVPRIAARSSNVTCLSPSVPTTITGEISPSNPVAAATVQKQLTTAKTDKDPKGSNYGLLQAKGVAKSKTSIKVSWKKVSGAKKYIVYGNLCGKGKSYKKIKTVTGTSFTQKGLKKGKYYKYVVDQMVLAAQKAWTLPAKAAQSSASQSLYCPDTIR